MAIELGKEWYVDTMEPRNTLLIKGNRVTATLTVDEVLDIAVNGVEFAIESLYDYISTK
jgi:hypothetical protein